MQTEETYIRQLIIKPVTNETSMPSADFLASLQSAAQPMTVSYSHTMSLGALVFSLEPALPRDEAQALAQRLSELPSVEYAEPDYPRYRR